MEFTVIFDAILTLQGGVPLPKGSVLKGITTGYNTTPENWDVVTWEGVHFVSEAGFSSNEKPLIVKGLTEGREVVGGRQPINQGIITGSVKTSDFTCTIEKTGDKNKLDSTSAIAFLDLVMADLATKGGVNVSNLSVVIDKA